MGLALEDQAMQHQRGLLHNSVAALSLVLATVTAFTCGISMVAFPNVRGATPGGGGAAHDYVVVCLVDGRLIAVRRIATLVSSSPDMQMTSQRVHVPSDPRAWPPAIPLVWIDLHNLHEITVEDYSDPPPRFAPESYTSRSSERDTVRSKPWGWLGFDFCVERPLGAFGKFTISNGSVTVTEQTWAISLWPLLLASLIAPARLLWRNRRSQRWAQAGRCSTCGYDLRATPGRCPECGEPHTPAHA